MTRRIVLSFLLVTFLLLAGCASTRSDFDRVRERDTVEAYESFIQKHPESELTAEARRRLQVLIAEREREKQEWKRNVRQDNDRLRTLLNSYKVDSTNVVEFREDGWSVADAWVGRLGLVGYQKRGAEKIFILGRVGMPFLERIREDLGGDFDQFYVIFARVAESHWSYVLDDDDLGTGTAVMPTGRFHSDDLRDALVFERGLVFRGDVLVEVNDQDLEALYGQFVQDSRR